MQLAGRVEVTRAVTEHRCASGLCGDAVAQRDERGGERGIVRRQVSQQREVVRPSEEAEKRARTVGAETSTCGDAQRETNAFDGDAGRILWQLAAGRIDLQQFARRVLCFLHV